MTVQECKNSGLGRNMNEGENTEVVAISLHPFS